MDHLIMSQPGAAEAFRIAVVAAMENKGISQSELSRRLNISPPALYKVLSGEQNVTLPRAERIATELGLSLENIFGKSEMSA